MTAREQGIGDSLNIPENKVRIKELPITPDKVLAALKDKASG